MGPLYKVTKDKKYLFLLVIIRLVSTFIFDWVEDYILFLPQTRGEVFFDLSKYPSPPRLLEKSKEFDSDASFFNKNSFLLAPLSSCLLASSSFACSLAFDLTIYAASSFDSERASTLQRLGPPLSFANSAL